MGYRHHREHLMVAGSGLPFNAANFRWLNIRAWNQGGVNDTFNLIAYYPKPFIHVRNITSLGVAYNNLHGYWPMNDTIYDGPNQLSPANYNPATRLVSDPIGGVNATASAALVKNGPIVNSRNGFYTYAAPPGAVVPVLNYDSIRFGMTSVSTWAIEFTFFPITTNSWLILDTTSTITEYVGIFFNPSSQLVYADSLGTTVAPLASGISGWNHFLVWWDTANLHTYLNGVATTNIARAGILYPNNANRQLNINHNGQNWVSQVAHYRGFPTAGLDWAGTAKQHYENQFLNYQQVNPMYTSGSVASGQGWGTILSRDVSPGIPDNISFGVANQYGVWYVEIDGEIEI